MKEQLYVGNLPVSATDADLRTKFARFGTVLSASVSTDRTTGRSKRCALVEMANRLEAQSAINGLNMTQYDEMVISVSKARSGQQG
jgi:RNA recognition motif-containing protein